jgi:NAD(P)-dependent dehydrogenase (short-subunit alcohol dehydrogenase family)
MSKFAVNGLTRTMALQYAKSGIRINAVCPGVVDTPIVPPGMLEQLGATFPIGRVARPVEIANTVVWLASEEASYITGVTLPIDGGMMA